MPTAQKAAIIEETREALERSQGTVLADYRGLTVQQMNQLRERLSQGGVTLRVVKNTLIKRAADQVGIEGLEPYLTGPTVLAYSAEDPVAAAKLLSQAIREFRKMEIKAGILGKKAIDASGVKELAELPSKEVLLGKVVGTLNAPIQQLVWVLNAPLTNLARVLDQIRQQREGEGQG
ncbi:MAG: 50S ribosomal protein L10 [Firmicutes bacterium]|nr:50S ribosomal protein L10 [Bacillota bacterium]